jgi:hypothetical protein
MKTNQRKLLVFSIIAILVVGYIAFTPIQLAGAKTSGSNSAEASTPYGESIGISIGSGSSTSGSASIIPMKASYSDDESQNVYDVNGTYKSQELVSMSYTLSVTHASVTDITATVKIKAIDNADASMYEYTIANAKALSGASPISDDGEVEKAIATHLTEITASVTGATVTYEIYCQVTATGSVSGETLTATVAYTQFGALEYTRTSESSAAEVTPTVSVASVIEYKASVIDETLGLPDGWTIQLVALASVTVAVMMVKKRWF